MVYADGEPMTKYTKQGISPRFNPIYGGNSQPHRNAEMIESTSFLFCNDRGKKKSQFCYSGTKAGKAEASYIIRIKKLLDTIETPGVITMALSKETELGIEKILALKRLILGTTALLQVAWVH